MNILPARSDEEAHAAPSLATMVSERGTNMDQGRAANIIALLEENGIDTWEKFEKSILPYATKRDALREGFYKCIKKGIKLGFWEGASLLISTSKSRATAVPMAIALAWTSTAIADILKRNKVNAKYNPQEIPESHSYYAKSAKTAVQLLSDVPPFFVPWPGIRAARIGTQMVASFAAAYVLNNRKAVGEVAFLDGDQPELLEALLERRKQSNRQALPEFVTNDLISTYRQVPRAAVTATISPKTGIKILLNTAIFMGVSFVPSKNPENHENIARTIRDAAGPIKKFIKKQIKKYLDYREEQGQSSYSHKQAGAIADVFVDDVVSGDLARRMKSRLPSLRATAAERQPLLVAATAEDGAAPDPPSVRESSASEEASVSPQAASASQALPRPDAPHSDMQSILEDPREGTPANSSPKAAAAEDSLAPQSAESLQQDVVVENIPPREPPNPALRVTSEESQLAVIGISTQSTLPENENRGNREGSASHASPPASPLRSGSRSSSRPRISPPRSLNLSGVSHGDRDSSTQHRPRSL